jgi:aminoglycoside/choline kinase family phosphotransferase
MLTITDRIKLLFQRQIEKTELTIKPIVGSGSNRHYFTVQTSKQSYIACYGKNVSENKLFIEMAESASKKGAKVPSILAIEKSKDIYIQSDEGKDDLLNYVKQNGWSDPTIQLYKTAITELIKFRLAITNKKSKLKKLNGVYNRTYVLHDLLYFKFYFLDYLKIEYNKGELMQAFEKITQAFNTKYTEIIYRDFQARNILVKDSQLSLIDFQGAMFGPHVYDLVSLLWQAQAKIPAAIKTTLKDYYYSNYKVIANEINSNESEFNEQYQWCVLLRILQTLGAYGLKGLVENKSHFKKSIALALENLNWVLTHFDFGIDLKTLFAAITNEDFIHPFREKAKIDCPLKIKITSFSYKKGIPIDESSNGGGFVFDMRGILNPGRFEAYKKLSGLDNSVKTFLENETKMPEFIDAIKKIITINIEDYMQRGFESLMINFGCTGGQHRSVYAAEAIQQFIQTEFGVTTTLEHTNQTNWVK